jgi:hypothetical protein
MSTGVAQVLSPALDGIRRVNRAPAILAGVWLLTFAVSLPLALAMRGMLAQHLGGSLAADAAASGVNYDWMQEFADQASGLGVTFKPTIVGFGAVLDNLSTLIDNTARPIVIVGAAGAYIVLWLFVAGGIIDRYARDRATRSHGFFAASGTFFFRFLRLGVVMFLAYWVLFSIVHPWLFTTVWTHFTRQVNEERTAFAFRLVLYVLFGLLLAACNLVFDYAKVRAVVEDRRSMLGAISASLRFVRNNGGAATLLYLADVGLFVAAIVLYAIVAPGAGRSALSVWAGFVVSQAYIAARLWVKLVFWASETALFQGRLAHAGYIAAPPHEWPESPTAEAILRPQLPPRAS